jgi:hypothetical protein
MPSPDDTENLLEFVLSRLKDIGIELKKLDNALQEEAEEKAAEYSSSVIFYLHHADEGTAKISRRLSEISATLGEFLLENYNFSRAKEIVAELGVYIESYLRRVSLLRRKINSELEKVTSENTQSGLKECVRLYERQLEKIPSFMRRGRRSEEPQTIISRLRNYYKRQGNIDILCGRVNDSAIKVLGKFSAYLQEVERKAKRLEFLDRRIKELASLPPDAGPADFLFDLLRPAFFPFDPNYWDAFSRAEPEMPRYSERQKRQPPRVHIRKRRHDGKIPQTLDEVKLHELRRWLEKKYPQMSIGDPRGIEDAEYSGIEDFYSFMQLAKYGLLGEGRMLNKIGYTVKPDEGSGTVFIEDKEHCLEIPAIFLEKQKNE